MVKELLGLEPEDMADDDVMCPVDMGDLDEFEDSEKMIETLGVKRVAEAFVKARKNFMDKVEAADENTKECLPQEMTFAVYKECIEEEGMEDCESEEEIDSDEVEGDDVDEDEAGSDGEADGAEPSTKKQKTA